jgi:hypothetical protein
MLDEVKSLWTNLLKLSLSFQIYREDVRKLWFLRWGPSFENEPEIQDYGHSLIEMIMAKGSNTG